LLLAVTRNQTLFRTARCSSTRGGACVRLTLTVSDAQLNIILFQHTNTPTSTDQPQSFENKHLQSLARWLCQVTCCLAVALPSYALRVISEATLFMKDILTCHHVNSNARVVSEALQLTTARYIVHVSLGLVCLPSVSLQVR
jgi:hypothetical protein